MVAKSPSKAAELYWLDAQCPTCQALGGIRYAPGRRPTPQPDAPLPAAPDRYARCNVCGWRVGGILPKVHDDLMWARTLGESVDAILLILATQAAPVADAPPVTFAEYGDGTYKARVRPAPGETPAQRLERLADQFALNGGTLRKEGGYIRATSQRRGPTGSPVLEYAIGHTTTGFVCSCEATRFCAHLAGLWAHFTRIADDPDAPVSAAQRASAARLAGELAVQAGCCVHDPIVRDNRATLTLNSGVAA